MLATLLTTATAVSMALLWICVCLLPLCLAWGLWRWIKSPSGAQHVQQQSEHDALITECEALMAESRALQAVPR